MRATVLTRILLFLSSYFPLFVIFGLLWYEKHFWLAVSVWVASVLTLLALAGYLLSVRRTNQRKLGKVMSVERKDGEVMGYVASYLIPFVTFSIDNEHGQVSVPQVSALVIFLLVLLVIYVNSNMIYINPVLTIFGYHLYSVEIEHGGREVYYLARKAVRRGESIRYVRLSDDIYLER
ncbi:MAG: hypothetical protein H0U76_05615 [Ktedonobacteraceae bacterium]|nr:hypothetical protein [Ktedonobacteraceae bacterium]